MFIHINYYILLIVFFSNPILKVKLLMMIYNIYQFTRHNVRVNGLYRIIGVFFFNMFFERFYLFFHS